MKRAFAILFSGILMISLAACGSNTQDKPLEEAPSTSASLTESAGLENSSSGQIPSSEASETPSSEPQAATQQAQPSAEPQAPTPEPENNTSTEETKVTKMNVQVGGGSFTATLESNSAVDALIEMMKDEPVVIQMSDYSGFEKVGSLGASLPASNSQTTTHAGDIVLYNGNQIVIFYGSNSWSYTRLGKIDDLSGWEDALGSGDVEVTFTITQ